MDRLILRHVSLLSNTNNLYGEEPYKNMHGRVVAERINPLKRHRGVPCRHVHEIKRTFLFT